MHGAIPPLPQYVMAWCLVKHRDNFTFYLYRFEVPATQTFSVVLHLSMQSTSLNGTEFKN